MSVGWDIVKAYFPAATDEQCRDVAWNCTGFPSFWNIPCDGATPEACFRKQLLEIAERSGRDPDLACCLADQDLDAAMHNGKLDELVVSYDCVAGGGP